MERGVGASTFEALIHALAINLIMVEDPAQLGEDAAALGG